MAITKAPAAPLLDRIPPVSFFAVSAIFHYLGPSFAVLLLARLPVLGVAALRIWSAALAFALWRRPWHGHVIRRETLPAIVLLGLVLAAMNTVFYFAVAQLPLATVAAIEFLGVIALAAWGTRTVRNGFALLIVIAGIATISHVRVGGDPIGFAFAFANCALFVGYIVVAHRVARSGSGIDGLALAMLVAAAVVAPFTLKGLRPAFSAPILLLAGAGVGITSSFIPYVTDQLAMARLPRASFALMLSSLPVVALIVGAIVLRQLPTDQDVLGILLVAFAIALHRPEDS
jgi:inner membrane transporter RhtA